jgi:hypothetical protein
MEITNAKHQNISHICKFPLSDNTNSFPVFGIAKILHFVKRHWFWIGFVSVVSLIGFPFILMRIEIGGWDPNLESFNFDSLIGGITSFAIFVIFVLICAGVTWGRSSPSGRTRITRPTSDSVDGFGAARGYDYSHAAGGQRGKGPLPVSLRVERKRTDTFRDGEKDWITEDDKMKKKKR